MPQKELERLEAVHRFLNLNINKDRELQEIVELASELCETPIALIIIEHEVKYLKIDKAFDKGILIRNISPEYPPQLTDLRIVPDTLLNPSYAHHPLVTHEPYIRFYAGAPLVTHDGHILGSLCIMGSKPAELTASQQHLIRVLAKRIIQIIEFEFSLNVLKQQFIEVKEAEIKLRSFFESSGDCHLLIGKELEVLTYNKNMYRLIRKMHEVKLHAGMHVSTILRGEYLDDFIKDYKKALEGITTKYERKVTYRNGETIWWHVTFEPGYDPEGKIIGISYNAQDITERKLYESRIIEQNESLKEIAHIQSHEFRKPVASILGFIELFKLHGYKATKEELKLLEAAAQELDHKICTIVKVSEKAEESY